MFLEVIAERGGVGLGKAGDNSFVIDIMLDLEGEGRMKPVVLYEGP